ncbi:MAG: hypothetical protein ACOYN0_09830 [Phycisphaerales bacterium]
MRLTLNQGRALALGAAAVASFAGQASAQWATGTGLIYFNGGKVGIGTATPTGQLHVVGSTGVGTIWAENDGTGASIIGWSRAATGLTYGTYGQSHSTSGYGALGWATNSSGSTIGVYGQSDSASGFGGLFKGGQFGVYGWPTAASGNTVGVYGRVSSPNGWGGVFKGGFYGVWGETNQTNGFGGYFLGRGYFRDNVGIGTTTPGYPLEVVGTTTSAGIRASNALTTGSTVGVQGQVASEEGVAVNGQASATSGTPIGVYGTTPSTSGVGVSGYANSTSGFSRGVEGWSTSPAGAGVYGISDATTGACYGVFGTSATTASGAGVRGETSATTGTAYGVLGVTPGGAGASVFAVYAQGNTGATGTKSFQIDHPLDPANKLLNHFSAEGPEPYLVYRGNVELDAQGEAVVELPAYFDAINRDVTYQLTPIGAPALLYVSEKVADNHFKIAGGKPGMEVSWTVTGIRNDAHCTTFPMPTEADKPASMRGKYLDPAAHKQPAASGAFYTPTVLPRVPRVTGGKAAPAVRPATTPSPTVPQPVLAPVSGQ